MMSVWWVNGMRIRRGIRSNRRKPAPVPLCPPQMPHGLTWARTRTTAVGNRWLIACATSSSLHCFSCCGETENLSQGEAWIVVWGFRDSAGSNCGLIMIPYSLVGGNKHFASYTGGYLGLCHCILVAGNERFGRIYRHSTFWYAVSDVSVEHRHFQVFSWAMHWSFFLLFNSLLAIRITLDSIS
jgi:hypothetical protein